MRKLESAIGNTDADRAPELSCRPLKSLLVHFRNLYGRDRLERVVRESDIGEGIDLAYLEDENNWVSFQTAQTLLDALATAADDEDFVREAGRITGTREVMGFVYGMLRACGSPKICYKQILQTGKQYNAVGTLRPIELSDSYLKFAYKSDVVEPNLRFSDYRMGQFESFPRIWGLPMAKAKKLACQVTGDPESIYEFTWIAPKSNIRAAFSALLGGLGAAGITMLLGFSDSLWWTSAGGALLALLVALIHEQRKEIGRRSEFTEEQNVSIMGAVREVQSLNTSLERKVDERTEELAAANEQLQQMDRMKRDFFANVSHELRTPLTLSLGPVDSLLSGENDPGRKKQLSMLRRNQIRLLKLINNLLDFSKLEAGRLQFKFQRTDIRKRLRILADNLRTSAKTQNIDVLERLPEDSLWVYVDPEQFDKIVMNLMSNAYKFTEEGGKIELTLERTDGRAVIRVRDTGIGIPKNKQAFVFERFSQVDASATRKYAGTGIGLAMVKEYTEMHGGSVAVESEEGVGSTFILSFPLGKEHHDPVHVRETEKPIDHFMSEVLTADIDPDDEDSADMAEVPAADSRYSEELGEDAQVRVDAALADFSERPRVLIVDDTPDMRKYLRSLLESDYEVITAKDGEEGLRKAQITRPDVVLSDMMMPRMSGDELCHRIKSEPGAFGRTTQVILITARTDLETKLLGKQNGADDYLQKPVNKFDLHLSVRNAVEKRRNNLARDWAHQELAEDNKEAALFQRIVLPKPPKLDWLNLSTAFRPMLLAGGDFYDIHVLSRDRVRVILVDTTGHGVEAAIRIGFIKLEYERLLGLDAPQEVLFRLNATFCEKYASPERYGESIVACEAICADVTPAGKGGLNVTISSASGHKPLHQTKDDVQIVPVKGVPLGCLPKVTYRNVERVLGPGERLYFYTDGVVEQRNRQKQMFGTKRLMQSLEKIGIEAPLQGAVDQMLGDCDAFRGRAGVEDDVAMLAMEGRQ